MLRRALAYKKSSLSTVNKMYTQNLMAKMHARCFITSLVNNQSQNASNSSSRYSHILGKENVRKYHKLNSVCSQSTLTHLPKRTHVTDLYEAHEKYGLFRKGQNIGYLSTLMQDPSDAHVVKEDNYHELHHYFDIPELAENINEKLVEVKISQRTKVNYNSPTGSWMQVIYPFAENEILSNKYKKFADDEIIVGRMLEDIDAICAETAYRYIRGKDDK
jgi:hypothetical protein